MVSDSDGMQVDLVVVRQSARAIDQVAQELATAVDGLQATVTSSSPWGRDEPGSIFGALYLEVLGHALQTVGAHVDQLRSAAAGLGDWATDVSATDQANEASFHQIASRL